MKTKKEREEVVRIEETINSRNSIITTLQLEVEYFYPDNVIGPSFAVKKNVNRSILVKVIKDGVEYNQLYNADGFVTAERVMDIHSENFLNNWSYNRTTNISYVGQI